MKARIFGGLFVLAILVVLYVLTGGDFATQNTSVQSQPAPQNPNDNAFKDLKIN